MINKIISIDDAVRLIRDEDLLALGGMTLYRRPLSFVRSLIKHNLECQTPKNLTLLTFTAGLESDLLVGSQMVSKVRTCYFGLEIFGFAPMFTYFANRGELSIIEETEASLALGLRAQMAGLNFLPGLGWIGTDLPKLRPDVKKVTDPYSGDELMAFPAIKPDLAVIHALSADQHGNAVIGKNKGIDEELAIAADKVIITSEEILPDLNEADIASPFVDAVVLTPGGAKPTSCHPRYQLDGEAILAYVERVSNLETWKLYIEDLIAEDMWN